MSSPKESPTLSTFFENVYVFERELKPNSLRQLQMSIALLEKFAGRLTLDELSHDVLNRWRIQNPSGWAPKTMKRRVQDVLSVWSYAYAIGETQNKPNRMRIQLPRVSRQIPEAWSLEELRAMYDAAAGFRRYMVNGVPQSGFLRAVLGVGFYSALRAADLMVIRRSELSPKGSAVAQAKKHGVQVLVVTPQWVIDEIDSTYPPEVERVFAWPYSRPSFYLLWRQLLEAAGLPVNKAQGLQKLRRTSVTHGEAISRGFGALLAGHEPGSRVTYQAYVDPRLLGRDQTMILPAIRQGAESESSAAAPESPAAGRPSPKSSEPSNGKVDGRTLREIWDREYRPAVLHHATEETLQLWRFVFGKFRMFLDAEATLTNLNDDCLAKFRTWRRKQVGDATTTNRDLLLLIAFWQFCHREDLVAAWPAVKLCREPAHVPRNWKRSEFDRLIKHLKKLEGKVGEYAARDFWVSLAFTICDSGERITNVLGLRWGDVDFTSRSLHFTNRHANAAGVENSVAVSSRTIKALDELRVVDGRTLLAGPIFKNAWATLTQPHEVFRGILEDAGLPTGPTRMFDSLRRKPAIADLAGRKGGL